MSASALRVDSEPTGFAQVYREHHAFVWQTLRCLGVIDSALDDAIQDVFVVVHRRLPQFEGRASMRTWLFEIARRVAMRYRSRAHRDAARTFEMPELRSEEDVEAAVDRALAFEVLRAFTDSLDDDRLRVFMLSEFGQLRGREIAEALEVNINTVYARLRSAQKQLDRLVARLRARETGAMMTAARRSRPSRASTRQTWSVLVAKLGLASAPAATAGAGGLAAVGWSGWVGLMGLAGALVAGVVVTGALGRAASEPEPAAVDLSEVIASVDASPGLSASGAEEATPLASTRTVPPEPEPLAVAGSEAIGSSAASQSNRGRPPSAALAAEVALVRELRAVVARRGAIEAPLARYHHEFPQGVLRPEVEALVVEHRCHTGAGEPEAEIAAFARRWPRSALVERLRSICPGSTEPRENNPSMGPQKSSGPGTQSL
ncbi:MAG: sigma-70 family RNA polymerase sigma factor [Myxococcota bacterium]